MLMISTKANKPRIGIHFDLLTFRWDWQCLEQKLRGPGPHSSPSFAGVWIPCYHLQVCSPETHSPPQQRNYFSAPKLGIHVALVLNIYSSNILLHFSQLSKVCEHIQYVSIPCICSWTCWVPPEVRSPRCGASRPPWPRSASQRQPESWPSQPASPENIN